MDTNFYLAATTWMASTRRIGLKSWIVFEEELGSFECGELRYVGTCTRRNDHSECGFNALGQSIA